MGTMVWRCLAGVFTLCAVLTSASQVRASASTDEERAAVLAAVETTFEAIARQDAALWRSVVLDDGLSIPTQRNPGGGEPTYRVVRTPNSQMAERLAPDGREYRERFTAEPTILIRGPIAVVWGEYDFWIDGEFSHCGVDAIDLIKLDGTWMVINLMWTMERTACPTAPSE